MLIGIAWATGTNQGQCTCERASDFSFVDCHVNVVAPNFNGMDRHRFNGRHAQGTAGLEIESSAVARTLDLTIDQFTFGEGTAVVGAHIVNRVVFSRYIEQTNRAALDLEHFSASQGQLVTSRDFNE